MVLCGPLVPFPPRRILSLLYSALSSPPRGPSSANPSVLFRSPLNLAVGHCDRRCRPLCLATRFSPHHPPPTLKPSRHPLYLFKWRETSPPPFRLWRQICSHYKNPSWHEDLIAAAPSSSNKSSGLTQTHETSTVWGFFRADPTVSIPTFQGLSSILRMMGSATSFQDSGISPLIALLDGRPLPSSSVCFFSP